MFLNVKEKKVHKTGQNFFFNLQNRKGFCERKKFLKEMGITKIIQP